MNNSNNKNKIMNTKNKDKNKYIIDFASQKLEFGDDYFSIKGGEIVMCRDEDSIMQLHAKIVCGIDDSVISAENKDILEFGFGMGMCSDYIQSYNPKSHTIIDCHPDIISRLEDWATDKPSVKIIKGDWFKNLGEINKGGDGNGKYDGVFFDTHRDENMDLLVRAYKRYLKPGGIFTFFNAGLGLKSLTNYFDRIDFTDQQKEEIEYRETEVPHRGYFRYIKNYVAPILY